MTTFSLTFPTKAGKNDTQECPLLLSSSGFPALVEFTGSPQQYKCTYNTEFFDWDTNVNKAIKTFVNPSGESFTKINEDCTAGGSGSISGIGCTNWNQINRSLLTRYCTRNSHFLGEGCPNYGQNYYDPELPASQGCSKMSNIKRDENLCSEWVNANFESGGLFTTNVNQTMAEYCQSLNTNDCACIDANKSVVFDLVNKKIPLSEKCWWIPCKAKAQAEFLVPDTTKTPTCGTTVCVEINNLFANDSVLQNVTLDDFSSCGDVNPDTSPWYEKWWVWIIILTLIVIIFAVIIFYTSGGA